jgi:hypothetical protein
MAYTESQRAALQEAIASGVLRVSYDGKTVEYRSLAELREALAEVERNLSGQEMRRSVKIYADKGL